MTELPYQSLKVGIHKAFLLQFAACEEEILLCLIFREAVIGHLAL